MEAGKPTWPEVQKLIPSQLLSLLAALAYGCTSLAMVFLNKGLLVHYPYPLTILTLQMAVSAALVKAGGSLSLISVRPFSMKTATDLLPLAAFYNANVAFALASLQGVNIPMYAALKRLNPLGVLVSNFFLGKPSPPVQVTLSVLLIAAGCIVAGSSDFTFDLKSYIMALASVTFQVGYLLMVERSGAEGGLNSSELLLYNSVLSLPVLATLIIITGEAQVSLSELVTKMSSSMGFTFAMVLLLVMGCLLNFTVFLCTLYNSALTTTIVGVLKSAASTTLGFFVLGGVGWSGIKDQDSAFWVKSLFVSGHVLNTVGGVWYSVVKYRLKQSKKKGLGGDSTVEMNVVMQQDSKESGDEAPLLEKGEATKMPPR